jgi:hypothetical protein
VQPASHGFVISAALARARSSWNAGDERNLLAGHRDEDDLVVFGRWRFRAAGLSHTYKPADETTLVALAEPASRTVWPEDPAAIAELLANASAALPADTTRTPWGRLAFERLGRGVHLTDPEIAGQARLIVPLAVEATAALLGTVPPPG